MTKPYDGEAFDCARFLVFAVRFVGALVMGSWLVISGGPLSLQAPLWKYFVVSASNVASGLCQYEALRYVSYVVQILGKSFKIAPVMIWGMILSNKKYSFWDWCTATIITLSVALFLGTGPTAPPHDHHHSALLLAGLFLLVLFLACDSLTSSMQEKIFNQHRVNKYNLLLHVNAWSALASLVLMLASSEFIPALRFCARHPKFMVDVTELSILAALAQYFITSMVQEFGALATAAAMNVRQVVSIIASYYNFHHAITSVQIVALAGVMCGLAAKSYLGLLGATAAGEEAPLLSKAVPEVIDPFTAEKKPSPV